MVGLVGHTKVHLHTVKYHPSPIKRMSKSIITNSNQKIKYFSYKYLNIALVTHSHIEDFHNYALNEDRSIGSLIYGKIFDFSGKIKKLKEKGHIFKDEENSAEFIVHAYEEYGDDVFRDLNGSFLLVIFDVDTPNITMVTDRFGTRPAYYAFKDDDLIFSSSIKGVLGYPLPLWLNEETLVEFLRYGRIGILGDKTWFKGIRLMPPASKLRFTGKSYTIEKYWDLEYSSRPNKEDIFVKALVNSFVRAVNMRIRSVKGKVCVMLSGGLDSRSVLGSVKDKHKIFAITIGDRGCDDINIAKKVCKRLGIRHVIAEYNLNDLAKYAQKVVQLTDGQCPVNVSHVPYVAERMMLEGVTCYLQGYMFDLLLGGSYLRKEFFNVRGFPDFVKTLEKRCTLFSVTELRKLLNKKIHHKIALARKNFIKLAKETKGDCFANKADYFFIYTRVRRWTLMGSIINREYIEELLPTIDNEVIDIIRHIPPELRYNHRIYRRFLLALNSDLGKIPYQKTLIPPIVPTKLWHLSRVMFFVLHVLERALRGRLKYKHSYFNFDEALRLSQKWRDLIKEILLNENSLAYIQGYLNREYVTKLVEEHWKGVKNNGEKIAFLITFELFLRNFFSTMLATSVNTRTQNW